MKSKKILVFGVFDGIHEGHLSFISDAKKQGDQLIAIVARDIVVEKLKNKLPLYNEVQRIKALLEVQDIDLVLLGDPEIGTYNILKEVKPDIVFLGYDQDTLFEDLNKKIKNGSFTEIEIVRGDSHNPEIFHSSIINKKTSSDF